MSKQIDPKECREYCKRFRGMSELYHRDIVYGLMERVECLADEVEQSAPFHPILSQIMEERRRQDEKWGEQNHHPLLWFSIIGEEFGEMCQALNDYTFDQDPNKLHDVKAEAVQMAACCVAMLECMKRMDDKGMTPDTKI